MKLLAIDTAAAACGVAIVAGGSTLWRAEPMARGHAEALLPMVTAMMADAGLAFAELDAIAVSVGPGAFTGLRIGIAAARGLALATARPCFGVPTLTALAAAVREGEPMAPILVVLDSKRDDVYAQAFAAGGAPLAEAASVPKEGLAALLSDAAGEVPGEVLVAGDVVEVAIAALTDAGIASRPAGIGVEAIVRGLAAIAAGRWRAGDRPDGPPRPLYLRPPDTGPAPRARR